MKETKIQFVHLIKNKSKLCLTKCMPQIILCVQHDNSLNYLPILFKLHSTTYANNPTISCDNKIKLDKHCIKMVFQMFGISTADQHYMFKSQFCIPTNITRWHPCHVPKIDNCILQSCSSKPLVHVYNFNVFKNCWLTTKPNP